MRYTTYNLSIQSDIELPELLLQREATVSPPDVFIRLSSVSAQGLPNGQQVNPFLYANRESLWLHIPKVARFLVQNGNSILIDPEPGIDEDSIRVFLLGSALGALLFQRGHLVLHGNAIRIGDQCMVCVGESGVGKSTLAAGFMQRGFQILSDDVVPVDKAFKALPGFPRIKLWQDVADKLQIDTTGLRRIRPGIEKFNYPLGNQFCQDSLPIRWIYILSSDDNDGIHLRALSGMQRFLPLYQNTYRMEYMCGMKLQSTHIQSCGQLAGHIRLVQITRPKSGFKLDMLISKLLADTLANP